MMVQRNQEMDAMPEISIKIIRPPVNTGRKDRSSKILINPYHGCSHRCLFCPANDGFIRRSAFDEFRSKGVIRVIDNIVDHVKAFVENNPEAKVAHLSPVADPFQPIEETYRLSINVMKYCVEAGFPIALCSKGIIPPEAQELLLRHAHSFAQVSIVSPVEEKRHYIVRGDGANVDELLEVIRQMTSRGILVIGRIDPIFPYITDDLGEFESLAITLRSLNVRHIVSSVADITVGALERESSYLDSYAAGLSEKYKRLYTEKIGGRMHASVEYRKNIFAGMLDICKRLEVGFGITWEPDRDGTSLARNFSYGAPKHLRKDMT